MDGPLLCSVAADSRTRRKHAVVHRVPVAPIASVQLQCVSGGAGRVGQRTAVVRVRVVGAADRTRSAVAAGPVRGVRLPDVRVQFPQRLVHRHLHGRALRRRVPAAAPAPDMHGAPRTRRRRLRRVVRRARLHVRDVDVGAGAASGHRHALLHAAASLLRPRQHAEQRRHGRHAARTVAAHRRPQRAHRLRRPADARVAHAQRRLPVSVAPVQQHGAERVAAHDAESGASTAAVTAEGDEAPHRRLDALHRHQPAQSRRAHLLVRHILYVDDVPAVDRVHTLPGAVPVPVLHQLLRQLLPVQRVRRQLPSRARAHRHGVLQPALSPAAPAQVLRVRRRTAADVAESARTA